MAWIGIRFAWLNHHYKRWTTALENIWFLHKKLTLQACGHKYFQVAVKYDSRGAFLARNSQSQCLKFGDVQAKDYDVEKTENKICSLNQLDSILVQFKVNLVTLALCFVLNCNKVFQINQICITD